MAAPSVRVTWSRPSRRAANRSPNDDRSADAAIEATEMSRTEDVSRALSAVLTCTEPGTARVRRDISGRAAGPVAYDCLSTCAACHGCTGTSTRAPSRSSPGHTPVTRHSAAGTGTSPSSTTGPCSGP